MLFNKLDEVKAQLLGAWEAERLTGFKAIGTGLDCRHPIERGGAKQTRLMTMGALKRSAARCLRL